jgi:hypothetical protein
MNGEQDAVIGHASQEVRFPMVFSESDAREILRAEGNWPLRGRYFPKEEAARDFYVMAAFQSFWDSPDDWEAALTHYLR